MTIEELEIIVSVKIAEAIKEFKKIVPVIKQTVQKAQESFDKMDTTKMKNNINQAVQQIKKKMQDLRKSNENNQIKLNVNNKDAQKQISQIQKQIDSLNEKINSRQMKLNTITPRLDEITARTTRDVTPQGVSPDNPAIQKTVNNSLNSKKEYTSLLAQESKMTQEIAMYNNQLTIAKNKMAQLKSETNNTATSQNKLTSFFNGFGSKIKQAVSNTKGISNNLKELPKITNKINFNGLNKGMKKGIGHVFRYAGALLSLESIYGLLSSSANAWLNSQNAGAQQLNANIEYMRYAMGSALAPVIQFVTNLVYQLMKAVQSVVYALTGVNIFANAGAKAYSNMANSAKKATKESKQLVGVHDEINNIQETNPEGGGSGTGSISPNFDLSEVEGITSNIIDAIKNGNWYEVGEILGNKLNDAMNNIDWGKIQSTAKNIGTQIAKFLNGFIATTNWNQVGNTFAQGLNTVIYFGYSFVTTFDWKQFGIAIGDSINGFLNNIDWATAGQTLSEGIKGVLNTITQTLLTIDWSGIGQNIVTFMTNIDWQGIVSSLCSSLGSALGGVSALIASILLEAIIYPLSDYFLEKTEEAGGNIVLGILKGIVDGLIGIGEWIYNNMIYPFVSAFCEALGIHSPSTVFQEFGKNIIQGLFNGIQSLVDTITKIWNNIKQTATEIFTNIKTAVVNKVQEIKEGITQKFQDAYNSIKNIFSNIGNFFSGIWNNVKNTFSNLGTSIGNAISNAVRNGINGVISLIQNTINKAIGLINGAIGLINMIPGVNVGRISTISLPRLAKGGVLYEERAFVGGEYSGARTNPEIVTPQNIMEETFDRVLSRYQDNNSGQPIYLTVNVGNKKLGQVLLDDLRDRKRRTGSGIEALVGG